MREQLVSSKKLGLGEICKRMVCKCLAILYAHSFRRWLQCSVHQDLLLSHLNLDLAMWSALVKMATANTIPARPWKGLAHWGLPFPAPRTLRPLWKVAQTNFPEKENTAISDQWTSPSWTMLSQSSWLRPKDCPRSAHWILRRKLFQRQKTP